MLCISFAILFLTQNSKLIASRFDSFMHGIAKAWHREQKIVSYRIELCTVAIKMSNILLNLFKIFMQCKHTHFHKICVVILVSPTPCSTCVPGPNKMF